MRMEMGFTQFLTISTAGQIRMNDDIDTDTDIATEPEINIDTDKMSVVPPQSWRMLEGCKAFKQNRLS